MFVLHPQNQTRNGSVVQIVSIFELNTPFILLYLLVHILCRLGKLQVDEAMVDVVPLEGRHRVSLESNERRFAGSARGRKDTPAES